MFVRSIATSERLATSLPDAVFHCSHTKQKTTTKTFIGAIALVDKVDAAADNDRI